VAGKKDFKTKMQYVICRGGNEMINFKKIKVDDYSINIEDKAIYINNISSKHILEEEKPFPQWLVKLIFLMLILPLIQIKFIGFYLESKEVIIPFIFLIIIFIIGIIIHQRNKLIFLMVIRTNDSQNHVIYASSKLLLRKLDEFMDFEVEKTLIIHMGNGNYEILRDRELLNYREGNIFKD
jgi:hypothetical protein